MAWLVYAMIGALAVTDLLWNMLVGLAIGRWWIAAVTAAGLFALSAGYRLRRPSLSRTAETGALWILFAASGCVLTYLCASTSLPLRDDMLARMDHAFGVDWVATRALLADSPNARLVAVFAYASLLPQIVLAILYLPAIGREQRGLEFIVLAAMSLFVTCLISALCPALGPLALAAPREAITCPIYLRCDPADLGASSCRRCKVLSRCRRITPSSGSCASMCSARLALPVG